MTKSLFLGGCALMALVTQAGIALADDTQRDLMIAIDISKSNVIIENSQMAAKAASTAAEMISDLQNGDRLSIRSIGSYSMSDNPLRFDLTVSRRMPARRIAASIERLIASLPELVAKGKLPAGGTTHITAFLEEEAALLSCNTRETVLVLFSDGIEASPETSPDALSKGRSGLPAPDGDALRGCALSLYGIGETTQGAQRTRTENLITAWTAWAEAAGVSFDAFPKY